MAAGTWDDFTDKYGFNDGAQLEQRDFDARTKLVALLNARPEMQAAKVRALEFDRGGVHNSCLIVLVPAVEGKSDAELMADWMAGPGDEAALPTLTDHDDDTIDPLGEMIEEAYNAVDAAPALQLSRPLTSRELATVLHGLRMIQDYQHEEAACDHFEDETPLSSDEIDALCESINLAPPTVAARLEYLRGELRAERISYGELHELQSLAAHIQPGDTELLEAAGVPESETVQQPTPPRVVVVLEGGAVTGILSAQPVEVAVIDYDTEGAEAENVTKVPQNDAEPFNYADAYTTLYPVEVKPERTAQLFAACQDAVIAR